jgi:adenylate cyclase
MPDLIAQGPEPTDRWRKNFPPGVPTDPPIPLGRTADHFEVPWDKRISRTHAVLIWDGRLLHVSRHIDARNPIFFRGHQDDQFHLQIGEHFVIGSTTFTLANQQIEVSSDTSRHPELVEQSFTTKQLAEVHYQDAQRRVDALARLPSVLSSSANDEELVVRVVNVLMNGIRHATFVAIVRAKLIGETARVGDDIQILHWDSRDLNRRGFSPSRSLIHRALTSGESVLHMWNSLPDIESGADSNAAHTAMANVDWAFCVPIAGESSEGWAIYVAGTLDQLSESDHESESSPHSGSLVVKEELKFTELTATTISAVRQSRLLQQRQDMLRPFFAPVVRNAILRRGDDRHLRPRETDVSVLFCDLRGFSQRSEEMEGNLLELLQRVSDALGITTRHIMLRDGVVGDFHGDAAMGFWGWPIESSEYIAKAVEAALAIHREFKDNSTKAGHALAGFQAGLGIASGRAVAGQIGTVDQVKITVFGPVVNLASRLEGMTKQVNAPILIDEITAHAVKATGAKSARVRRVAKVLPSGMNKALVVSELLPPASEHPLSDAGIAVYESALDAFQEGDWETAFSLLHNVPSIDRVKDYLTVYIAQHGRRAPSNWNGVITLQSK